MTAQIKVKVQQKAIVRLKVLPRYGAVGTVGPAGPTGPTGPTGTPGMLWRGNWSSATSYVANDGVAYNGNSYICINAHAATVTPPLTANWNLVAQGGTASIADSQLDPIKLNSDNPTEQHLFRDRLNFVARDGDTMTASLILPGNPVAALGAVPKQYVDFTQAGTGAVLRTPQDKMRERVSVKDFGALGDWNGTTGTDDQPAFQAAIDAVAAAGGGDVFVPAVAMAYRLNAQIVVKPKVRLIGAIRMQTTPMGAVTLSEYYGGSCIAITWGSGTFGTWGTSNGCALWMQANSGVSGLNFIYPGQRTDLTLLPIAFPPTIAGYDITGGGPGGVIENVCFVNSYIAMYFPASHYNLQIRNINGGLIHRGLVINGAIQADQITNVTFAATNYLAGAPGAGFAVGNNGGFWNYVQSNGIAFDIGRADAIRFIDCGGGDCLAVIRFGNAPVVPSTVGVAQYAYGSWHGGVMDGASYGVKVEAGAGNCGIGVQGFLFTSVGIAAVANFAGTEAICVLMDQPNSAAPVPLTETRGRLMFSNCLFWGNGNWVTNKGPLKGVLLATGGDIHFTGCSAQVMQFYIVEVYTGTPVVTWVGGTIDAPVAGQSDPTFVHWLGGAAAGSINWLGTDIRGGYKANIAGTTTLSGAVVYAPANAGHISGLTLSAAGSSATFGIAAGAATSDDGSTPLLFPSAFTKTTAGFSFGTAGGALDTGVIAINTWYHAFIFQTATGATDIAVSTSTAPALLASSKKRRIGAMKTDGAGQWVKFFQTGNDFVWDIPVGDVSATNPGTSAVLRTLSVPLGIKTRARITVTVDASAGQVNDPGSVYISDPAVSDGAASINNRISLSNYSATDGQVVGASMECWTNTSSQVRTRLQLSGAATILAISTIGWHDLRGTL